MSKGISAIDLFDDYSLVRGSKEPLEIYCYQRGYKQGNINGIYELADMLTNDWGLDIILSFSDRKSLKDFILLNADQLKEQKNDIR